MTPFLDLETTGLLYTVTSLFSIVSQNQTQSTSQATCFTWSSTTIAVLSKVNCQITFFLYIIQHPIDM